MFLYINNNTRKQAILNKIEKIKKYKVTYDNPPAFGKPKPGFTTVPSITEMQDNLRALYKLLFDEHDEHTGIIDEIEELVKELSND